ncbi:MAG: hypothetical protein WAU41_11425 [Gaiellaceae bacterium]
MLNAVRVTCQRLLGVSRFTCSTIAPRLDQIIKTLDRIVNHLPQFIRFAHSRPFAAVRVVDPEFSNSPKPGLEDFADYRDVPAPSTSAFPWGRAAL